MESLTQTLYFFAPQTLHIKGCLQVLGNITVFVGGKSRMKPFVVMEQAVQNTLSIGAMFESEKKLRKKTNKHVGES